MTRRPVILLGLLLISSTSSAQAPPPTPPPISVPGLAPQLPPRDTAPKTGTARIRGRVVAADTGQPLRKAQVRATSAELRENRLTTTDANGVYELAELPAGRYQLTASKGSFVQLQYGQTRPFEAGKPLQVGDGQTVDKVDFSLPRGGLVTGTVIDEFGEGATDVQVSAMRYQFIQGRRQLMPAGRTVTTNDIGEYRLFGLPPGQYYIGATLRAGNLFDGASNDRSGYAPTYYPSTANIAGAERLTVDLGQTRNGIDIVLATTRTTRITGTVVDADGKPLASGMVMMMQMENGGMPTGGNQIRPDGGFTITNVAPGEYTLLAINPQSVLGGGLPEMITATVTVTGEDITGLRLAGARPVAVTGRVVIPQNTNGGSIRASAVQLMTTTVRADMASVLGGLGMSKVNDDFAFEMKVPPGQRLIRLVSQLPGVSLKAVRLNGVDVTDSGIDVRPNLDVTGVEVELTTQQSQLSGAVTDGRSQMVKDYSVVVFARDPARWTNASRFFGEGRPDQDGRFQVRNLPPGDYYAVALSYLEPGSGTDPEFLDRIRDRATPFSLTEGAAKMLDLKLVTAP
jgi:hypothetical protein